MQNNIRELRQAKLLKQSELVQMCNIPGFDVPTLSRIETGKVNPTEEIITALQIHLQASYDELFGEWKEIPLKKQNDAEKPPEPPMIVLELVSYLRHGRNNAKSRRILRMEMDVKDRTLRKAIELAPQYGYLIGNLSDGEGYFLIDDEREAKAYYEQEFSRAMAIMKKIEPLRIYLYGFGILT